MLSNYPPADHSRKLSKEDKHKPLPTIRTTNNADSKQLSPERSRTDPVAPEHNRHEKSSLHKRLHSSSLRNRAFTSSREHGYRHAAKETVQSAIELKPPISFDTLLRRDKKTPENSRRGSGSHHHYTSQQQQRHQQRDAAAEWAAQQRTLAQRRHVSPSDITKAKAQNTRRERELRDSLKGVEEIAMSSTRQLDDTYYAILEKASILRNTVASLQQLAEESTRLHAGFKEETSQLEKETKKSLEQFGNFDGQERQIRDLVSQLKSSKERTNSLNTRLEAARNRVEAYEVQEKERQKARRIRYGAVWAFVAGFLIFILAVMIAKHRSAVGSRVHTVAKTLDGIGHELAGLASPVANMLGPRTTEDPFLRKLFDEL